MEIYQEYIDTIIDVLTHFKGCKPFLLFYG